MNKMKKWTKNINESDIKKFYNKGKTFKKIPKALDVKAINIIDNYHSNIKKEKIKQTLFEYKSFRYAFSTAALSIILISIFFIFFKIIPGYKTKNQLRTDILSYNGDFEIKGIMKSTKKTSNIKSKDIIKTAENSNVFLSIGDKTTIKVFELSEIKFTDLSKDNLNEICKIFMKKGKIECLVTLPSKDSIFEIYTDIAVFKVKGTHFILSINEKQDVTLNVIEGIVQSSNFIKKTSIINKMNKDLNPDIYKLLNKLITKNIQVQKDESIIIKNDIFKILNNDFNLLIEKIKNNSKKNNEILNEINKFEEEINNLLIIEKENIQIKSDKINNGNIDNLLMDKPEITFTENKIIFIYEWVDNQYLDKSIEAFKKRITAKIKNPVVYSISYKNIDEYYLKADNLIFFLTMPNLKNNYDCKKYIDIEPADLKKELQLKKILVINKNFNNKKIIIFAGENEKELVKAINQY